MDVKLVLFLLLQAEISVHGTGLTLEEWKQGGKCER